MATQGSEPEVLVVGAGPVGLFTSLLLSRLGVGHRLVERRSDLHRAPQAHVVSSRTREIFRAAGLDESALRAIASPPGDVASIRYVHTLAGPDLGQLDLATPSQIRKTLAATPTPMANISQNRLEPLLREAVEKAGVRVEFGLTCEALDENPDGVLTTLRPTAGGDPEAARFRFVLACDGAGSRLRRALGIEMIGPSALQHFAMVDVQTCLRELVGERTALLYWHLDPLESAVVIAHDLDARVVFMMPIAEGAEISSDEAERRVADVLGADLAFRVNGVDRWVMTAQVADRYGVGRVFLLGDAAHRFPPTGGLGMNTGMADAFNLAWKLAAVLHGAAEPALLDSYETERRPSAQANCDQSTANFRNMGAMVRALGLPDGGSPAELREAVRSLPEDPARQAALDAAIAAEVPHYDLSGLDWGQAYEQGALLPDGSPAPPERPTDEYVPSSRPGARLPHAWLQRDGVPISSHDLPGLVRPLLLLGPAGTVWERAARGLPLDVASVDGEALVDPDGSWATLSEVGPSGALLIRPDRHVAFRAAEPPPDPRAALVRALHAMFLRIPEENG